MEKNKIEVQDQAGVIPSPREAPANNHTTVNAFNFFDSLLVWDDMAITRPSQRRLLGLK
jgi:hypothetical protein